MPFPVREEVRDCGVNVDGLVILLKQILYSLRPAVHCTLFERNNLDSGLELGLGKAGYVSSQGGEILDFLQPLDVCLTHKMQYPNRFFNRTSLVLDRYIHPLQLIAYLAHGSRRGTLRLIFQTVSSIRENLLIEGVGWA